MIITVIKKTSWNELQRRFVDNQRTNQNDENYKSKLIMITKAIVMQKFRWKLFAQYYMDGNITIYGNIAAMTGIQFTII